jgi:hypothetical protein
MVLAPPYPPVDRTIRPAAGPPVGLGAYLGGIRMPQSSLITSAFR